MTSPSAGVGQHAQPRIDFAIEWLRRKGFDVVVGECMSGDRWISAPKHERAAELMSMLADPSIRAVVPPWGGAGTALDILDLLDYDAIARAEPTWFIGFSDCSTLMVPLTLLAGLATLHGDNLADTPYAPPAGLAHWLDLAEGVPPLEQRDSGISADWHPIADATATEWQNVRPRDWDLHGADELDISGVLIGGCIEVMAALAGTPYGDVRAFGAEHGDLIVYLEAAEEPAFNICRHLHQLRYAGWFDHAAAILIGSTNAPDSGGEGGLTQREAVLDALGGLGVPIVFDVEIGHVPPHLLLLNGASAHLIVNTETHAIQQTWV